MTTQAEFHQTLAPAMDALSRAKASHDSLLATIVALTAERDALKGQIADLQNQLAASKAVQFPAPDLAPEKQIIDEMAATLNSMASVQ